MPSAVEEVIGNQVRQAIAAKVGASGHFTSDLTRLTSARSPHPRLLDVPDHALRATLFAPQSCPALNGPWEGWQVKAAVDGRR